MCGLDAVFFASSNTQEFANDAARQEFRERWLGRYLRHDPNWAYVAVAANGAVVGYLVASVSDPALTPRFADIAYFSVFKDLTQRFPAHLHVNLATEFRSAGLGSRLIKRFVEDAKRADVPGVHVVTSRGSRNVAFYERNGFWEHGATGEGARAVVFLARAL